MNSRPVAIFAATVLATTAMPAFAQSISGLDAMRQYNLVVLGDLQSSSEVEGRTFVGGNLSGNSSNYQIRPLPTSPLGLPGLTVVGDVTGGHKNLNNSSGAIVGGNVASGFNLNGTQTVKVGGTLSNTNINQNTVHQNLGQSDPSFLVNLNQQKSLMTSSLTDLSQTLKGLESNSSFTVAHNRATFNATPNNSGVAVFNLTAADLDRFGEIQFNLNGAETAIVNVAGQNIVLNDNWLGNSNGLGEKVIWNFPDATTLKATTAWRGSVLAPTADAETHNFIQGSAVFGSLKQNGEMHVGTFNSNYNPPKTDVPTPENPDGPTPVPEEAVGLFGLGALALIWARYRRRRKAAALAG